VRRYLYFAVFLLVTSSLFAKKTEVRFWHILGYHVKPVIGEMVSEYNTSNPEVSVKADFQGFFEDAQVKMLTAAVTKQLPEVAQVPVEFLQSYIVNGLIEPINADVPEEMKQDVPEKLWKLVSRDGNIYGLPFCILTDVFIYNENAFLRGNLDPERPPSTWEELIAIGKRLSRDSDGDGVQDTYESCLTGDGENTCHGLGPAVHIYDHAEKLDRLGERSGFSHREDCNGVVLECRDILRRAVPALENAGLTHARCKWKTIFSSQRNCSRELFEEQKKEKGSGRFHALAAEAGK